ncbi:MAG: pantoate--beta-alanine ligase [Pirellulales bacterium]|nr:pantoate--beta-alanine ligase [Pirellulales bacterium]
MKRLTDPGLGRQYVHELRAAGHSVGIVPTMGALHQGHLSLVRQSRRQCDRTIATIFVNPTQFGPQEDLQRYPRNLDQDLALLADEGVSAVFIPSNEAMYPGGFSTFVEPPEVAKPLEGIRRPGHFRGVVTVVMKLFQILPATHAFFGYKDYQQWKVIEAMVRDLNVDIQIVPGQTIREQDGLALSSRNRYLSDSERQRALLLSQALQCVADKAAAGESNVDLLQHAMREVLMGERGPGVDKIDYAVVVDAQQLSPLARLDRPAVALVAAFVGKTRLIDNQTLFPNEVAAKAGGG